MTGQQPAVVPQRATLVLPSTGEFDSRAWRIASSLARRGHGVTVVARSAPGLPQREDHPAGYRIRRVPVSATDGLPAPLGGLVRRVRPGASTQPAGNGGAPAVGALGGRASLVGRVRRGVAGLIRLAAIGLTVRSQRLATRRVAPPADLVHAMAYMGIPVGLDLGRRDGATVVYDARDIYTQARNIARLPGPARRLFAAIERRWAQRAGRVMTVNRAYAEELERRLGVSLPAVVLNCSPLSELRAPDDLASERRFHAALRLEPDDTVVLYHGGLSPERGIEQLIEALAELDSRVHLVLMGYGPLDATLRARSAEPALAGRLHVLPAVAPDELISWVAAADVAAMPIQPSTLNHRLTTPNKLFEAMAAGVPIVASDLPGMATIVRETGCGVLCDPTSVKSVAAAVRTILGAPADERATFGRRGLAAVRERYNWEAQLDVLLAEYGQLTGRPW